jgi:hypothetical protein
MIKNRFHLALCALACLGSVIPAAVLAQQASPLMLSVDGGFAAGGDADLSDGAGSFAVDRWFLSAGVSYAWDRRTSLGISFGAGESSYDFSGFSDEGTPAPWGTIEDQRLSLTGRFGFGETGSVIIIPSYRYNGMKDSDSGDARTWSLLAGAAWRVSENLNIGPGFGMVTELEDSTRFFPILVIDWNITERLNLSTGRGLAASQGPGLTLSYRLRPAWSIGLSVRYEDVRFRLDSEAPVANGIGRNRSLPVVASLRWDPTRKMAFSVFAGAGFAGELETRDANGVTLEKTEYDTAPLLGATFDWKF